MGDLSQVQFAWNSLSQGATRRWMAVAAVVVACTSVSRTGRCSIFDDQLARKSAQSCVHAVTNVSDMSVARPPLYHRSARLVYRVSNCSGASGSAGERYLWLPRDFRRGRGDALRDVGRPIGIECWHVRRARARVDRVIDLEENARLSRIRPGDGLTATQGKR